MRILLFFSLEKPLFLEVNYQNMLLSQKHLFSLPDGLTYLNTSYMSPQLKSVEQVGYEAIALRNNPSRITNTDFFTRREVLKQRFASLIEAPDHRNIAIIPSVSYGMASVAQNISLKAGDEIVVLGEQFPSNVYIWQHKAAQCGAVIKTVLPPEALEQRGKRWNEAVLEAIGPKTALVAMSHVHWADGTRFDLKTIREKTHQHNALLVIDGTQSVGALPFSVADLQPDALVCAGYKWLLGSYGLGMAYYSDYFNDGKPLEHNWLNRENSEDFSGLTRYRDKFREKADRYSVGESSNFILVPMLIRALEQLLEWQPGNIQRYCETISRSAIERLRELGCFIEKEAYRGHHLFGVYLPENIEPGALKQRFMEENIFVSVRGDAIRVSPHLYNTEADLKKLTECFINL